MIPYGLKHVGTVNIIIWYNYLRRNIVHFVGQVLWIGYWQSGNEQHKGCRTWCSVNILQCVSFIAVLSTTISQDVMADAGFLCDRATVLSAVVKKDSVYWNTNMKQMVCMAVRSHHIRMFCYTDQNIAKYLCQSYLMLCTLLASVQLKTFLQSRWHDVRDNHCSSGLNSYIMV
jgi:hypothetical protein